MLHCLIGDIHFLKNPFVTLGTGPTHPSTTLPRTSRHAHKKSRSSRDPPPGVTPDIFYGGSLTMKWILWTVGRTFKTFQTLLTGSVRIAAGVHVRVVNAYSYETKK